MSDPFFRALHLNLRLAFDDDLDSNTKLRRSIYNINTAMPARRKVDQPTALPSPTSPTSEISATDSSSPVKHAGTTTDSDSETPNNLLEGIPEIGTFIANEPTDQVAALKLVADSIAQQRQHGSRAVIFHPAFLAVWFGILGVLFQFTYTSISDLPMFGTTSVGISMAMLIATRMLASGYLVKAEAINWLWLLNQSEDKNIVIVTRFGEIIGTVILRLVGVTVSEAGKKSRGKSLKTAIPADGKALIRAWTVQRKFRGKGEGKILLKEAIKVAREQMGESVEVSFAPDHANSQRVMPNIFNGKFNRDDKRARVLLERLLAEESVEPEKTDAEKKKLEKQSEKAARSRK
ncbi:MAG: hypothetical protein M1829_004565 [Trizodia sp. TS-e1964]|nr:MAG: hypothetical protein M1829_004565 [Trizodia sp. TS-e1964]